MSTSGGGFAGNVPQPAGTVVGPDAFGAPATPGAAAAYSRGDHDHGLPALPAIPAPAGAVVGPDALGAAAHVGTAAAYARGDHDHGLPTAVATWNGRAGAVAPASGDYDITLVTDGMSDHLYWMTR